MYIFHGTQDEVVRPASAEKLSRFYESFLSSPESQLLLKNNLPSSHAVVSDRAGTECGISDHRLYIENCGFDR